MSAVLEKKIPSSQGSSLGILPSRDRGLSDGAIGKLFQRFLGKCAHILDQSWHMSPTTVPSEHILKATPIVFPDNHLLDRPFIAEGYSSQVYCLNHRKGQDAFVITEDIVAVLDGMGAYSRSGVIARYLAQAIGKIDKPLTEVFADNQFLEGVYQELLSSDVWNNASGEPSGHTTFSIVQKQPNGDLQILMAGDSPVCVVSKDGSQHWYGLETVGKNTVNINNGITNGMHDINISNKKIITIPAKDVLKIGRIVLATDGLTDNLPKTRAHVQAQIQSCIERKNKLFGRLQKLKCHHLILGGDSNPIIDLLFSNYKREKERLQRLRGELKTLPEFDLLQSIPKYFDGKMAQKNKLDDMTAIIYNP